MQACPDLGGFKRTGFNTHVFEWDPVKDGAGFFLLISDYCGISFSGSGYENDIPGT
jgi:hypothetical protein